MKGLTNKENPQVKKSSTVDSYIYFFWLCTISYG